MSSKYLAKSAAKKLWRSVNI